MAYREFAPPPALRSWVECGWTTTVDRVDPPCEQDVLPDGCMDLIWSAGTLLVAGPDTAAHRARCEPGRPPVVGLRFAPGALPGLLAVPASALRDRRVPLSAVHPRLGRAAEERLRAAADAPAGSARLGVARAGAGAVAGVAGVLADVALGLPGAGADGGVSRLAARIGGGAGVAATADALGWTSRTLHRRCLAAFGYGPAVLRRVLRFRRAAALLHAGVPPADVAARAGYADQPHLSREVRVLAGVSPAQLGKGANRSTPLPSGSFTVA